MNTLTLDNEQAPAGRSRHCIATEVEDDNDEESRVRVFGLQADRRDWRVAKAEGAWIQYRLQTSAGPG